MKILIAGHSLIKRLEHESPSNLNLDPGTFQIEFYGKGGAQLDHFLTKDDFLERTQNKDLIFFQVGGNDVRGSPYDISRIVDKVSMLTLRILEVNPKAVIIWGQLLFRATPSCGYLPTKTDEDRYNTYIIRTNEALKKLSKEEGNMYFLRHVGATRNWRSILKGDGVHMNESGNIMLWRSIRGAILTTNKKLENGTTSRPSDSRGGSILGHDTRTQHPIQHLPTSNSTCRTQQHGERTPQPLHHQCNPTSDGRAQHHIRAKQHGEFDTQPHQRAVHKTNSHDGSSNNARQYNPKLNRDTRKPATASPSPTPLLSIKFSGPPLLSSNRKYPSPLCPSPANHPIWSKPTSLLSLPYPPNKSASSHSAGPEQWKPPSLLSLSISRPTSFPTFTQSRAATPKPARKLPHVTEQHPPSLLTLPCPPKFAPPKHAPPKPDL
ncbi:uncharacterized protein LOC106170559 isoform X2 [Lingula anatina]|uniref:Uncharacterized protein LOC106170559 isoform X2 n=1 Tax=Lingula anatina TaxID=7574 RepID=A0A1S3J686_LINAN|nr:uncharacterized protein LOC106170559 isoform X2 [Lingula anatina]|eukprot:XP_013405905.1 uncharacterized protein LOC106170559 isoform X2 [Lingula anatina]